MVGMSGAGKTTMGNGLLNHFLGVSKYHDYRFALSNDEKILQERVLEIMKTVNDRNKAEDLAKTQSVTSDVHIYHIPYDKIKA